ncbi:hypothetical protein BDV93DRAFT_222600 [Ceratobasidium sp. AG-I]|nr:hypothetical protein BDV93DRAFT_222600 [Ceratobasidium sp. AG-I]
MSFLPQNKGVPETAPARQLDMVNSPTSQRRVVAPSDGRTGWFGRGLNSILPTCGGYRNELENMFSSRIVGAEIPGSLEKIYRSKTCELPSVCSNIRSTQPSHHPGMLLVVEKACQVERTRGGGCLCSTGKLNCLCNGNGGPGVSPPAKTTQPEQSTTHEMQTDRDAGSEDHSHANGQSTGDHGDESTGDELPVIRQRSRDGSSAENR